MVVKDFPLPDIFTIFGPTLLVVVYMVNGWEGLMNKHTGKVLTPADYRDFRMISKDLIQARLNSSYDDESVVMDRRGNAVRQ